MFSSSHQLSLNIHITDKVQTKQLIRTMESQELQCVTRKKNIDRKLFDSKKYCENRQNSKSKKNKNKKRYNDNENYKKIKRSNEIFQN